MPSDFPAAVRELEQLTSHAPRAALAPDDEPIADVVLFDSGPSGGLALVEAHAERFRAAGAYLFLHRHGFGATPDVVGLARTTDKLELVRMVGTDGANYGHDNAAVVAWLRELDRTEPFELTGAGEDFVEGRFRGDVKDPRALAPRIDAFCPDFVAQGLGLTEKGAPEDLIARWFGEHRAFFFWWD